MQVQQAKCSCFKKLFSPKISVTLHPIPSPSLLLLKTSRQNKESPFPFFPRAPSPYLVNASSSFLMCELSPRSRGFLGEAVLREEVGINLGSSETGAIKLNRGCCPWERGAAQGQPDAAGSWFPKVSSRWVNQSPPSMRGREEACLSGNLHCGSCSVSQWDFLAAAGGHACWQPRGRTRGTP